MRPADQGQQFADYEGYAGAAQQQEDEHGLIQRVRWLSEHSMQFPHCSNSDEAVSPNSRGRPGDGGSSRDDIESEAPPADRRSDT